MPNEIFLIPITPGVDILHPWEGMAESAVTINLSELRGLNNEEYPEYHIVNDLYHKLRKIVIFTDIDDDWDVIIRYNKIIITIMK